jgi:hypothetical protein
MPQLSPNFAQREFELDAPIPLADIPLFVALCTIILEPIRTQFGPCVITSGYRTPASNASAHGVPHSEHMAIALTYCAADFYVIENGERVKDLRSVFDWVRENPKLAWGQVILEHDGETGADIIHVGYEATNPRRQAFEGYVSNSAPYKPWPVVPFEG